MSRRQVPKTRFRGGRYRAVLFLAIVLIIPMYGLLTPAAGVSAATAADVQTVRQVQTARR
jgi:hypothetical protein